MATVPAAIPADIQRGIEITLTGYIILQEDVTNTDIVEQIPDQTGAIAQEISYDQRDDLSLTMLVGAAATKPTVGQTIKYNGVIYRIESVKDTGSYNTTRKYAITAHHYTNWPLSSTTPDITASN